MAPGAGSERNGSSGSTGATLTEACAINKSLTTLGRVITELHARQQRARRGEGGAQGQERPPAHVPYRDSRLTYLLQVGRALPGCAAAALLLEITGAELEAATAPAALA